MCLRQLIPKTRLRIHSAAQEEHRPKAMVQSGQVTPPSPLSIPVGFHYRRAHSGTKQSREQPPQKPCRGFNAPKHTLCTVKDYGRHIFIIVGGT